jgi:hypothetical protein
VVKCQPLVSIALNAANSWSRSNIEHQSYKASLNQDLRRIEREFEWCHPSIIPLFQYSDRASARFLYGVIAPFPCADPNNFIEGNNKDFAVTNLATFGFLFDQPDDLRREF